MSRRRSKQRETRESIESTRLLSEQAAAIDDTQLDPASLLFLEFAGPLLMTADTDEAFQAAVAIAEMVWASTEFNTAMQVAMVYDFIEESEIPDELIPWLLDVYAELAERKAVILGK